MDAFKDLVKSYPLAWGLATIILLIVCIVLLILWLWQDGKEDLDYASATIDDLKRTAAGYTT